MKFGSIALTALVGVGLVAANPVPNTVVVEERQENLLNAFVAAFLELVPFLDGTLESVVSILTDFEEALALATFAPTTYNELGAFGQACTAYTLIFARGTTEPGNVGILVGPPLIDALLAQSATNSLTVQGVNNYGATVAEYLAGGDPVGSASMAAEVQQAYSLCPNTKVIMGGYSQGCQIVHNAAKLMSYSLNAWVSSVVLFGDPYEFNAVGEIPASRVDTYCNIGDLICGDGDIITTQHLTYGLNAGQAAAFIAQQGAIAT